MHEPIRTCEQVDCPAQQNPPITTRAGMWATLRRPHVPLGGYHVVRGQCGPSPVARDSSVCREGTHLRMPATGLCGEFGLGEPVESHSLEVVGPNATRPAKPPRRGASILQSVVPCPYPKQVQ